MYFTLLYPPLRLVCGHRVAPIELGASYLSPDAGQTRMTVTDFLQHYIVDPGTDGGSTGTLDCGRDNGVGGSDGGTDGDDVSSKRRRGAQSPQVIGRRRGYLAQHQVSDASSPPAAAHISPQFLSQVPRLREDVVVPDFCALSSEEDDRYLLRGVEDVCASDACATSRKRPGTAEEVEEEEEEEEEDVLLHLWLGPSDSVSPLHHDPFHNLLVQVRPDHSSVCVSDYYFVYHRRLSRSPALLFSGGWVEVRAAVPAGPVRASAPSPWPPR